MLCLILAKEFDQARKLAAVWMFTALGGWRDPLGNRWWADLVLLEPGRIVAIRVWAGQDGQCGL